MDSLINGNIVDMSLIGCFCRLVEQNAEKEMTSCFTSSDLCVRPFCFNAFNHSDAFSLMSTYVLFVSDKEGFDGYSGFPPLTALMFSKMTR